MKYINIHDTKTNLSQYIQEVVASENFFVICKNGVPMAQLGPYKPRTKRQLGLLKGKIQIAPDFDELPQSFKDHFE